MSRITTGSIGAADWVPDRLHSAAEARGGTESEITWPADELRWSRRSNGSGTSI